MREVADVARRRSRPEVAPLLVVPAVAGRRSPWSLAAVITFTRDAHTAAVRADRLRRLRASSTGSRRVLLSPRALADRRPARSSSSRAPSALLAGVLALALIGSGLGLFLYLVTRVGRPHRLPRALQRHPQPRQGRRRAATGSSPARITAVLALAFVLIPSDAVLAIGLFGAWAVIVGCLPGDRRESSLRGAARTARRRPHDAGSGS